MKDNTKLPTVKKKQLTLTIDVTQEDIDRGCTCDEKTCAIAQALIREGHKDVFVDGDAIWTSKLFVDLPVEIQDWIITFDNHRKVQPFKTTLPCRAIEKRINPYED